MSGPGERAEVEPAEAHGWVDLAGNAPGIGVSYEAARRRQADGVTVVMTRQLVPILAGMPAALSVGDVDAVFALARRSTTWATPAR